MQVVLETRTATRCSTCSYLNPLPGLRHTAICVNCTEPIDVAGQIRDGRLGGLTYTFGGYYDAVAESVLYDGEHELEDGSESSGSPLRLRKVRHVACHCGAQLDAPARGALGTPSASRPALGTPSASRPALGTPSASRPALDLRCAGCGDLTPIRWPDERTREWDPRITYLVGDAGDRGIALRQKLEGTVIPCGSCGAPLSLEGRRRVLVCTHCHGENILSDAILTKLYPKPEHHVFYLVYELDDDAYSDAIAFLSTTTHYDFERAHEKLIRKEAKSRHDRVVAWRVKRLLSDHEDATIDADVAREVVARTDLDKATVARIDGRLTNAMREKIVSQTSAPFLKRWLRSKDASERAIAARVAQGEALHACAADESYMVREAIASREDTPPELLAALRKDPHDHVREKARANKAYQPGFFTRLLGG
jgi:hypothetical protein